MRSSNIPCRCRISRWRRQARDDPWHILERDVGDGRLPGLLHGAHAGRRAARMADDAAATEIEQILSCGRCGDRCPAPGRPIVRNRRPAGAIGLVEQRRADGLEGLSTKLSSGSQYLTRMPLIWNWSTPRRRQNCCQTLKSRPHLGSRVRTSQPLRWACSTRPERLRRNAHAAKADGVDVDDGAVAARFRTRSWLRIISSGSAPKCRRHTSPSCRSSAHDRGSAA
jgi:hypothetical protein